MFDIHGVLWLLDGCLAEGLAILDPGVVVSLLGRESLVHILDYHALQEVLCFLRMLLEWLVIEVEVALDDVAYDLQFRVAWKRHLARQHDVQHNSHRPDVNLGVVLLEEYLWRNVVRLNSTHSNVSATNSRNHPLTALTEPLIVFITSCPLKSFDSPKSIIFTQEESPGLASMKFSGLMSLQLG